jgi:ankyrin repeat protein
MDIRYLLFQAAQRGDEAMVFYTLSHGLKIDSRDEDGLTIMHYFIQHQRINLIKELLNTTSLVSRLDNYKGFLRSLLDFAVKEGNLEIVELLLKAGADLSVEHTEKHPILIAAEQDNVEAIDLLLRYGASPNIRDVDGWTSLHLAVEWDSIDLLELLIHYGADVELANQDGDTPLHIAAYHGFTRSLVRLLAAGANVNSMNGTSSSVLHIAAREGNTELVDILMKHGAQVNILDSVGCTPLHAAAFYDESAARFASSDTDTQIAVVKKLLAHGADTTIRNCYGQTPYHRALYENCDVIVEVLLHHRDSTTSATPTSVATTTAVM